MKITIVIPNYNGEELLERNSDAIYKSALFYLKKNNKSTIEVLYVDDYSSDSSVNIVQKCIDTYSSKNLSYKIIQNKKNLGFASTINRGVAQAMGDIVILLNTDVSPQENFLEPLVESLESPNVFAAGCLEKSIENSNIHLRGRGIGKWEKGFLIHARGEVDKSNTLWVSGGSGAFNKKIWDQLGGFDVIYNPFYYEDIDLSYRALKSGYDLYFQAKSIVVHEHEKGAIKSKYSSEQIRIIAYRNQIIFTLVNGTDFSIFFSFLLWLPYHIIKSVTHRDWAFIKGFFLAFIILPKIVISSIKRRHLYKKTDFEVVKVFSE